MFRAGAARFEKSRPPGLGTRLTGIGDAELKESLCLRGRVLRGAKAQCQSRRIASAGSNDCSVLQAGFVSHPSLDSPLSIC